MKRSYQSMLSLTLISIATLAQVQAFTSSIISSCNRHCHDYNKHQRVSFVPSHNVNDRIFSSRQVQRSVILQCNNLNNHHHHHQSSSNKPSLSTTTRKPNNHDELNENSNSKTESNEAIISRRSALLSALRTSTILSSSLLSSFVSPPPSLAADNTANNANNANTNTKLTASWKAVDGLNSLNESKQFVSFDTSAYKAMMNDQTRTPLFERAIQQRLQQSPPKSQIVIDLGTGPYALFAIIAADAGAKHVYAIEANPQAAKLARQTVQQFKLQDTITILQGLSSDITLPDNIKADLAIAEIVGSIASEEGVYATILDAHKRLLSNPNDPSSWIPNRIQTLAAPASYTLHSLFQPPAFDWTKLEGEPVRFNCRDDALQLVSEPIIVEDIDFAKIDSYTSPSSSSSSTSTSTSSTNNNGKVQFTVDKERIQDNTIAFYQEFKKNKLSQVEAEKLASSTAYSISGIAFWPRLILTKSDNDNENDSSTTTTTSIIVNSRSYPKGGHQKSHWQTVLPIMSPIPTPIQPGDTIVINIDFDVGSNGSSNIMKPPSYRLDGQVIHNSKA